MVNHTFRMVTKLIVSSLVHAYFVDWLQHSVNNTFCVWFILNVLGNLRFLNTSWTDDAGLILCKKCGGSGYSRQLWDYCQCIHYSQSKVEKGYDQLVQRFNHLKSFLLFFFWAQMMKCKQHEGNCVNKLLWEFSTPNAYYVYSMVSYGEISVLSFTNLITDCIM